MLLLGSGSCGGIFGDGDGDGDGLQAMDGISCDDDDDD
jgi:hypothetical protein